MPLHRFLPRLTAVLAALVLLALAAGLQGRGSVDISTVPLAVSTDDPLAGGPWGVYTGSADGVYPAWQALTGDRKTLVGKVALRPRVRWMGSWIAARDIGEKVDDYISTTQREAGTEDVLVQMAVFAMWPEGEVSFQKALPAGYPAYYRGWVDNAARAIGGARVAMVLEPDLGISQKDGAWRPQVRMDMAAYAAKVFGALPRTTVYLDASSAE